ncbi:hypothetical protein J6S46_00450 [Candidatus Saccharibacteria bacterium]|nr:hypothetical protein [Candidatus Saccharibacteria bacterium]
MPTAKKTTKNTKAKKACCSKKDCKCASKDACFKTGLIVVLACIAGLLAFGTYVMVYK